MVIQQFKSKLKLGYSWFARHISPAQFAVILAALIIGWLLFVPPIHGYADNGDFYRVMYSNGLYHRLGQAYNHNAYVVQTYGIMRYFNEHQATLFSSQPLFVQLAIGLNKLFYSRTIFDIRFLGLVYYLFYLGALYLLTEALTFPAKRSQNYLVALAVVFVFADSSLTLYFNSLFAEPVMLLGMLYAFSAFLLLARGRYRRRWPLMLTFFVSVILLITVKQQNAPLALSFAIMSLALLALVQKRHNRLFIYLATLLVLGSGVATYMLITKDFNDINGYQTMTRGVLLKSKNPEKALSEGGIDRQFALLKGTTYYQNYMPLSTRSAYMQKHLIQRYNFTWVLKHYLRHPDEFSTMLNLVAKDGQLTQVKAVGDYVAASGQPKGAQTHYFTLYSTMMGAFFPRKFAFYVLYTFTLILVYAFSAYQGFKEHQPEMIMRFSFVVAAATIILGVMVVAIVGDGDADLAKHVFMVAITSDLLLLLLGSDIANHRLWQPIVSS